jgi:Ala-tRNA(Pro) deacylase
MMFTAENLFNTLDELGITTNTIEHMPLRTVAEAKQLRVSLDGAHVKNLFLKDKKKRYWLLVALEDTVIDLKQIAKILGTQKLSFANAEELYEILGIVPGAVSPFAIVNDIKNLVSVVLEKQLIKTCSLNFHPLRNDRTTNITTKDFLRFLEIQNHVPILVDCGTIILAE